MSKPPALQLSPNLIVDPQFGVANLLTNWEPGNTATIAHVSDDPHVFSKPFSVLVTPAAANDGIQPVAGIPVKAGGFYTLWAWVWSATGGTIGVGWNESDKNFAYVQTAGNDRLMTLTGQWEKLTTTVQQMDSATVSAAPFVSRRLTSAAFYVGEVGLTLSPITSPVPAPSRIRGA